MTSRNQLAELRAEGHPGHRPDRRLGVGGSFSLAETCAPVAWATGRWPSVDWIGGGLVWLGWEGEQAVWRRVDAADDGSLVVAGTADPPRDAVWTEEVLGVAIESPAVADPVIGELRRRLPGLRPFAHGSVVEGLVSSIVGQSISVAAAAVTEARLAALFHPGIEIAGRRFWPPPRADQLADADPALVRRSGVTWRRAEALVAVGRAAANGQIPHRGAALADPEEARFLLRQLPLVGPWTAESALLWGIGLEDAYPTNDVALLRAARRAYADPDLDRRGLDRLAEGWRPGRGWAARLLWTALLGVAPRGVRRHGF